MFLAEASAGVFVVCALVGASAFCVLAFSCPSITERRTTVPRDDVGTKPSLLPRGARGLSSPGIYA
jgi:hypothetical protein